VDSKSLTITGIRGKEISQFWTAQSSREGDFPCETTKV